MYSLSISKRGRKCHMGGCMILKDEKFFIETNWMANVRYPIKKNICFKCASNFVSSEFISSLQDMVNQLTKLRNQMISEKAKREEGKIDVPF